MAINTEDTIFDGAINEQAKSVAKAVAPKKRKPRKPLTFGQQVAIGGTTGVLFGAAATYAAKAYLHHEHEEQPAEEAFVVTELGDTCQGMALDRSSILRTSTIRCKCGSWSTDGHGPLSCSQRRIELCAGRSRLADRPVACP